MSYPEIVVCLAYTASVWPTARSNARTWWIGIIGSISYDWALWSMQLYTDVTLQLFFTTTSITGWIHWLEGQSDGILPVHRTQASHFFLLLLCATVVAGGYGFLLHTFANAWTSWLDSLILTFSVLTQFMLMGRRIESWPAWLTINILAVPLYMTHGLSLTASLYFLFWISVWYGLYQWREELQTS